MAKIKLKKDLHKVLENTKQALVKSISESMLHQPAIADEISWLLLEFTLEYPFPPTLGLAQKQETEREEDKDEHPLITYNAPDLELFSENQTITVNFDAYEELFETADQLVQEIEYEDRQPFIFQLYVEVCKALMAESSKWTHLNLAAGFHVTARDYEMCDEIDYLKKLLPGKAFNKIQKKIDAFDFKNNEAYQNDPTIILVNEVMDKESGRYEELLATLKLDSYTNVYTEEEMCFIEPYYIEMHMHKRPEEIEHKFFSLEKPTGLSGYFQYKFSNNIPQLVDFYSDDKLIWRKIFQYNEDQTTTHKFFLKSGTPKIEKYYVLKVVSKDTTTYEEFSQGYYDKTTYHKNELGQIIKGIHNRSMFIVGHKSDVFFEYVFEYKDNELFKITTINQLGNSTVDYCKDESYIEQAIDDFIEHICAFALAKMATQSLGNLDAVVLEYDNMLSLYFNIQLVFEEQMFSISSYEQYDNDCTMMNLSLYTSRSTGSSNSYHCSSENAEKYLNETYTRVCSALSQRIEKTFQLSVPVVCKYIYDDL